MAQIDDTLKKILASENLSFAEAQSSMDEIMTGNVSEVKLASWLTALRMKGETSEEIAGCAASMRAHAVAINCRTDKAIDVVGTGGDGSHTINISTAAALVAAGAGVTVAKHGNKAVSSSTGSADVLEALGVNVKISSDKMEECLNTIGIAFLFAPLLHPAMKYAMPVRKELGIRTLFNILGPLCNPAGVRRMVLGVYEQRLVRMMADAAVNLDMEHVIVVHGQRGVDEVSISGPTYVCEVEKGKEIKEYEFHPSELGLSTSSTEEIRGGDPAENAETLKKILSGDISGPKRDVVLLNAAFAVFVSGTAGDLKQSLTMVENSISSGSAMEKLHQMIDFTNI